MAVGVYQSKLRLSITASSGAPTAKTDQLLGGDVSQDKHDVIDQQIRNERAARELGPFIDVSVGSLNMFGEVARQRKARGLTNTGELTGGGTYGSRLDIAHRDFAGR
jgi:hypothetical protein